MDYGKLLGRIREKRLTQAEVAKLIGVSATTINNKLRGYVDFSQSEIRKLCTVLDIRDEDIPDYFFTEKLAKSHVLE